MNRFAVLIIASAAAAMAQMVFPASAAVMPGQVLEPDVLAFEVQKDIEQADCTFPVGMVVEARFVAAKGDCNPALAEATGRCLALDPTSLRFSDPFAPPGLVMKCKYRARASPPG